MVKFCPDISLVTEWRFARCKFDAEFTNNYDW